MHLLEIQIIDKVYIFNNRSNQPLEQLIRERGIYTHTHTDILLVANLYIKIADLPKRHVPFQLQVVELGTGIIWFHFAVSSVLDLRQCFYPCLLALNLWILDVRLVVCCVFRDVKRCMLIWVAPDSLTVLCSSALQLMVSDGIRLVWKRDFALWILVLQN